MTEIVVMAGGRGLRLHPLTDRIPKPMIHAGGKPMLEELCEKFAAQGHKEFTFCVCYKAELIMDYFGDGSNAGWRINYVHEEEPLGTAGALKSLPVVTDPFIVINADIITELNIDGLLVQHTASRLPITVALALHQYQVGYGVAEVERRQIQSIAEKPIVSWLVAAGIYCLSPRVLDHIEAGEALDMPELLDRMMGEGVNTYELSGHWADVGTFEALAKANGP